MANGQLLDVLAQSPMVPRLARIAQVGVLLRNALGREPTEAEFREHLAIEIEADPSLASDLNLEPNKNSRTTRGAQLSLQAWVLTAGALVVAWRTDNWAELANQLAIALPAAVALLGNAIALFGRLSSNPDPTFRLWKPVSWFRSATPL